MFLKPHHVLPEFLMHVQIVQQPDTASSRKAPTDLKHQISLPKTVIPLPQFEAESPQLQPPRPTPPETDEEEKRRKINDWMSQLHGALNSPQASVLTLVDRTRSDVLADSLASETGQCVLHVSVPQPCSLLIRGNGLQYLYLIAVTS